MKSTGPIPFPASPAVDHARTHVHDPLGEFGLETDHRKTPPPAPPVPGKFLSALDAQTRRRWIVIAVAAIAIAQMPFVVLWALQLGKGPGSSEGGVAIETDPAGIEISVDGKVAGVSPIQLPLPPGQRTLEFKYEGVVRSVPLLVKDGEIARHRFEFIRAAEPSPASTGTLQVTTDPSRVTIAIDGAVKGTSPLSIRDLAAGEHSVAVRFASGTVERKIQVAPGSTASVQVSMPSPRGALSGWVDVDVPASLRISEDGRLLGTTDIDRLMLPVGEHVLDIGSDELGFRVQRTVTITAGATTSVPIDLPRASLSINASPWAEAWIDGERIGETPIGNLSRPIGRHEVILRHPELGERRQTVLITLNQPARVSVDLRRKQ